MFIKSLDVDGNFTFIAMNVHRPELESSPYTHDLQLLSTSLASYANYPHKDCKGTCALNESCASLSLPGTHTQYNKIKTIIIRRQRRTNPTDEKSEPPPPRPMIS